MDTLLSAPILFFGLGAAIALTGARIPFPEGFGKAIAAYLLVAIGLKGGVALASADLDSVLPLLLTAALLSLLMPILGFGLLRSVVGLDQVNSAAIAAHYGSVSLVTFVTATKLLESQGVTFGGHMVAALAIMEGPAIVSGLLLAGATGMVSGIAAGGNGGTMSVPLGGSGGGEPARGGSIRDAIREAAFNGSVLLLAGSLLVGLVIGKPGLQSLHGLFIAPWDGVLCLFLLEMGYLATSRLREAASLSPRLIAFGIVMPLIGAGIGLAAASALGLGLGDAALLVTLCASASYIAVPAALRHALPTAEPGLSLPLSLGITFPFNILVGIPLYLAVSRAVLT
ncbi:sodium-dependent bicarbonate transport family permease (plasmid) [Azospirillum humicireducens]|uniref:Sodium-dependent bicarbonate transport family permease n=1 Tax=Azospirillum humicireducens TaxID=1226968 RepID=A0A2R4VVU9_9PROT|nr:sodium-dependent bicarbonate transport family permease [Azospirillum humicireducens]AWB08511.1 sodium-dependent bicarbonate transport family permease [Azospirillum humicireducens]